MRWLLMVLLMPLTSHTTTLSVLFLGNSHTYVNDLPGLTASMALGTQDTLLYEAHTPGGWTLAYPPNAHLYSETSLSLIAQGGWDYVILQEQSQIPVIEYVRENYMYPGIRTLDSLSRAPAPCTRTFLYMTWGHNQGGVEWFDGYASPDFSGYAEMQDSVTVAYMRIADELDVPVAPVGVAWKLSIQSGDPVELFNSDGYHASLAGTYLAACVFYATLFQKSPVEAWFPYGLSAADAAWLQTIAAQTVLDDPAQWHIGSLQIEPFEYVLEIGNHRYVQPIGLSAWRCPTGRNPGPVSRQLWTGLIGED